MKTLSGIAVQKERGRVQITQYQSENMEIPLVKQVLATYHDEQACVLTNTNEEAARIAGLLIHRGVNARLIQSAEGFRFINLAEVRYFLKCIDKGLVSPVIDEERWKEAKEKTLRQYQTSACLDYMKAFFEAFERTNRTKYRSDLADFVFESNLEDFCGDGQHTVLVSTIHKSKGREFDTVYMLLNGEQANTEEKIRKLYVGMTRAKQNLYIHCNTDLFSTMKTDFVDYQYDSNPYMMPNEITLQLTHRDVYLDFFKGKKMQILQLRSGMPLYYDNGHLRISSGETMACLSMQMRQELADWATKGYLVKSAKILFIVAWKGKDETEDAAVLLPELVLQKQDENPA